MEQKNRKNLSGFDYRKPQKKVRGSLVAAAVLSALLAFGSIPMAHSANALQNKMNQVFGSMSNVTGPGYFKSQRRGVLSGGSIQVRNKIMNTPLVDLQMPGVKAGCGGIDLFGGSFSFINAEQFVQLLRNVAANAKGYAFQVALEVACGQCMAHLNALQEKIQKFNEMFSNSCKLAQGLVNDTASAFGINRENEFSLIGATKEIANDMYDAATNLFNDIKGAVSGNTTKVKKEDKKGVIGNVVYQALKDSNARGWMTGGVGSDDDEYGLLMAVTGTIIIPPPEKDKTTPENGTSQSPRYVRNLIEFENLMTGGQIFVYNCTDDGCMNPSEKSYTLKGLTELILEVLVGSDGSSGVIRKFGVMSDNEFTDKEQRVMGAMDKNIGLIIRNISTASPESAYAIAGDLAHAAAMYNAFKTLTDLLNGVEQALSKSKLPEKNEMVKTVRERRTTIQGDFEAYAKKHPTMDKIRTEYAQIQKMIENVVVAVERAQTNQNSATF